MNQKTQDTREFPYVKLVLIVTLVLVVAIVGYSIVDSIGIIAQVTTAATTKNQLKLNENHLDVYRYIVGQSTISNFYMYALYGMTPDSMKTTYGANAPMTQLYTTYYTALMSTGNTDYAFYTTLSTYVNTDVFAKAFNENAFQLVERDLSFCEGAMDTKNDKGGSYFDQYRDEIAEDVDDGMENLKETAKNMGISFSTFLKRYMGNGVSKKEVRRVLEISSISAKFSNKLFEEYSDALSITDLEKYREENKENFYVTSYYSINLEKKDLFDKVNACKTLDEVVVAVATYYFDASYDAQYKKAFETGSTKVEDAEKDKTKADILTTVLAMNKIGDNEAKFTDKESTDYGKAAYNTAKGIHDAIEKKISNITKRTDKDASELSYIDINDKANTSLSDQQKFLFADGRKQNDYKALKSTNEDSAGTATDSYTLYIVEKVMYWETDKNLEETNDLFYIQLTDDPTEATTNADGSKTEVPSNPMTAKEKAQLLYDKLHNITDKDKIEKEFNKVVEENNITISGTFSLQEMVTESKLPDKNLNAWVYNPLRTAGDWAILPLTGEEKEKDDAAAAEAEKETEASTESESDAESEVESETDAESKTTAESETNAETAKPSTTAEKIYLVHFVERNEKTWIENARSAIAEEKINDWLKDAKTKYEVEVNYEFLPETKAETTADTKAETTADTKAETTADTKVETTVDTKAETEAESAAA